MAIGRWHPAEEWDMADKINGYGKTGPEIGASRSQPVRRTPSGTQAAGGARAAEGGDAVEITGTAARLKAIEARLASLPDVDQARVNALRDRLASGDYHPDPARIAAKLIRMEKELG